MGKIIGVDFDNTIVGYDAIFQKTALEMGMIGPDSQRDKKSIRDKIRSLPDGESQWQKLQMVVYGTRMREAKLMDGVKLFFSQCKSRGIKAYIVSHKTEFANYGNSTVNLRESALAWMEENHFFNGSGLGLTKDDVYFKSTRQGKIDQIKSLKCTCFIDDLEETFLEETFPSDVTKILYAPYMQNSSVPGAIVTTTWNQVMEQVFGSPNGGLSDQIYFSKMAGDRIASMERIGGGRNSKVYRIDCKDGEILAGKIYFRHSSDNRDRMNVEFSSLSFLWESGIRSIPQPKDSDPDSGSALYQFIEGQKINPGDITLPDIDSAGRFLSALEGLKQEAGDRSFGLASEACMSFKAIFQSIERRLNRFALLPKNDDSYRKLDCFFEQEYFPFYEELKKWAKSKAEEAGISFTEELSMQERTLSPSDFGFHNALREKDGRVVFLDFEYFGWDDPAKMVSDFLLHPAMLLSHPLKIRFVSAILADFKSQKNLRKRIEIVYPLFGLKWCLIILNEFVPEQFLRRDFAAEKKIDRDKALMNQLTKAENMLRGIKKDYEQNPYV